MTGKIAWKEGLALLPQHFQRADESVREDLHQVSGHPPSRGYGFSRIAMDASSLSAGSFVLRDVAGIFPGGIRFDSSATPFAAPSRELPPRLGSEVARVRVHLAMPSTSDSGPNLGPRSAFVEFPRTLADSATGRSRREVAHCAPNLSLRFSTEPNEGFLLLPIAEIVRGPQGQPILADDFLPVLLDVHAWNPLMELVRRLSESVLSRSQELERQIPPVDASGMRQWLECLHLRTHRPSLERAIATAQIHPAELHQDLLRLAGGLVLTRGEEAFPCAYEHGDPVRSILAPVQWLLKVLASELRSDNLVKSMNREAPVLFSVQLPSEAWRSGKRFHLAIRSGLAVDQLVQQFGKNAKTAARSKLQAIIVSALPGLEVRMGPAPAFFRTTGQTCFEITPAGPLWQGVVEEGFLGVYVPANLEISSMELLIEGA